MSISPAAFGQSFKFDEEHPFKLGDDQGKIEIGVDQTVLHEGEWCIVRLKFTNTNGSYPVYNWQFVRLLPLPGQLVIYDANKEYIGDLIAFEMGSRKSPGLNDWTYLYTGSSVGTAVGFRVGRVPSTKYMSEGSLPPGTYYLHLILHKAFISDEPYLTEDVVKEARQRFDRSELCRSNIIKVEIMNQ